MNTAEMRRFDRNALLAALTMLAGVIATYMMAG